MQLFIAQNPLMEGDSCNLKNPLRWLSDMQHRFSKFVRTVTRSSDSPWPRDCSPKDGPRPGRSWNSREGLPACSQFGAAALAATTAASASAFSSLLFSGNGRACAQTVRSSVLPKETDHAARTHSSRVTGKA